MLFRSTVIGFGFALLAVWLVSQSEGGVKDILSHLSDLKLPLLAGIGFGFYFVFMHEATRDGVGGQGPAESSPPRPGSLGLGSSDGRSRATDYRNPGWHFLPQGVRLAPVIQPKHGVPRFSGAGSLPGSVVLDQFGTLPR